MWRSICPVLLHLESRKSDKPSSVLHDGFPLPRVHTQSLILQRGIAQNLVSGSYPTTLSNSVASPVEFELYSQTNSRLCLGPILHDAVELDRGRRGVEN